jgi:hypothetical protein
MWTRGETSISSTSSNLTDSIRPHSIRDEGSRFCTNTKLKERLLGEAIRLRDAAMRAGDSSAQSISVRKMACRCFRRDSKPRGFGHVKHPRLVAWHL